MEIVSYWMKWSDACDFMFALEENPDYADVAEKVREQIEDRYQGLAPYGPTDKDMIVFASRSACSHSMRAASASTSLQSRSRAAGRTSSSKLMMLPFVVVKITVSGSHDDVHPFDERVSSPSPGRERNERPIPEGTGRSPWDHALASSSAGASACAASAFSASRRCARAFGDSRDSTN